MPAYLAYVKKALPLLEVGNSAPSPSWRSGLGNSAPRLPAIMPPGVREQSSFTLLQVWNSASSPFWTGNSAPPPLLDREQSSLSLLDRKQCSLPEVGSRQQCSLCFPASRGQGRGAVPHKFQSVFIQGR